MEIPTPNLDSPAERTKCLNCQQSFKGLFCPQCGQRAGTKPLRAFTLLTDMLDHVFDLEAPLIRTTVQGLTRPGWVARQYVSGRRRDFVNPIKFSVLCIALNVFVIRILGFDVVAAVTPPPTPGSEVNPLGPIISAAMRAAMELSQQYAVLFSLALLPVYAILMSALFSQSRWNYLEFLVLGFYVTGIGTLVQTVVVPIATILDPGLFKWFSYAILLYYFIAPIQFCEGSKVFNALKSAVVVAVFFIVQGILVMMVGFLAILPW